MNGVSLSSGSVYSHYYFSSSVNKYSSGGL